MCREEAKNNPQVGTTQEILEEIKNKPPGLHSHEGIKNIKSNPQVQTIS